MADRSGGMLAYLVHLATFLLLLGLGATAACGVAPAGAHSTALAKTGEPGGHPWTQLLGATLGGVSRHALASTAPHHGVTDRVATPDHHGSFTGDGNPARDIEAERCVEAPPLFPAELATGGDTLELVPQRLLVTFRRPVDARQLRAWLDPLELELEDGRDRDTQRTYRITHRPHRAWLRTRREQPVDSALLRALHELNAVDSVAPVYHRGRIAGLRGVVAVRPDRVLLRLPHASQRVVGALGELGLQEDLERASLTRPFRSFTTRDAREGAAYRVGPELLARFGHLRGSLHYDLIAMVDSFATFGPPIVSDFLYNDTADDSEYLGTQWDMKRMGARYAWGETTGAGANVFLFDRGVKLDHSDLRGWTQFDLFYFIDDPNPGFPNPADDHGTTMAGILGATHNDGGTSMAGWAPAATRTALRKQVGVDPFDVSTLTLVEAINYAATSGQAVLAVGLAAGDAQFIDATVTAALGANPNLLVCVAAGNDETAGETIDYLSATGLAAVPANLMVCGASQQTDPILRHGRRLSWGGAGLAGSRTGPELSVVAPGDAIITTDTSLPNPGYATARGTSLSTAHVAGLAALVRAKYPTLTAAQVKQQIEQTAAKTGDDRALGVRYTVAPGTHNLRNDQMGFGRADAAAVLVTPATETDADTPADANRARVIIRDHQDDSGAEPSTGSLLEQSDIIVASTDAIAGSAGTIAPGVFAVGSAADLEFTTQALAGSASSTIQAGVPSWLFVRVRNLGPERARGVRVNALLAACTPDPPYPDAWDASTDATHVVAANDPVGSTPPAGDFSYTAELPVGSVFIARLQVPASADFTGFGTSSVQVPACALARVVAANDVNFTRATPGTDATRSFNNLAQREMRVLIGTPLADGNPCSASDECTSLHCVDGRCCNAPCDGLCEACSAALKESGADDGTCGPARAGDPSPRGTCTAAGTDCGTTGLCDPAGSCAVAPLGAPCGSPVCQDNTAYPRRCDGSGECVSDPTGEDCTPFLCSAGSCGADCSRDDDCVTDHFCQDGTCVPRQCTPESGCTEGYVCVNSRCVEPTPGTGGTDARGGAGTAGGAPNGGGVPNNGGATTVGGAPTSGGASPRGGAEHRGGASPTAGTSSTSGGAPNNGGTTTVGGAPSSGGAPNSGGAPSSGGAANSGGAPTGTAGDSADGASSGGSKDSGGCGCRIPATPQRRPLVPLALLAVTLCIARRRGRHPLSAGTTGPGVRARSSTRSSPGGARPLSPAR